MQPGIGKHDWVIAKNNERDGPTHVTWLRDRLKKLFMHKFS